MSDVWAVVIIIIAMLIVYGIVMSKVSSHRLRKQANRLLPEVKDHLRTDRPYTVFLSDGRKLEQVRFVGISTVQKEYAEHLPFPLQHWLILERADGKRIFIKPNVVRMYEETGEG